MKHGDTLIAGMIGAILGLIVALSTEDWRFRAAEDELQRCKDEPDRAAWIARRPGEAHTTESCIKVIRFGSPDWIPEFSHPLQPPRTQLSKGKS